MRACSPPLPAMLTLSCPSRRRGRGLAALRPGVAAAAAQPHPHSPARPPRRLPQGEDSEHYDNTEDLYSAINDRLEAMAALEVLPLPIHKEGKKAAKGDKVGGGAARLGAGS